MRRYTSGQGEGLARFVLPIATRTYAKWVDPASARDWAHSEHGVDAWNLRLDDPATHVLVFERLDESIAACAFVRLRGETAHFGGLYVEDVGCGLGRMLSGERLHISREAGARTAFMLIRATNAPARALAAKAGFVMAHEDPCVRLTTVPRLVYTMSLESPAPESPASESPALDSLALDSLAPGSPALAAPALLPA